MTLSLKFNIEFDIETFNSEEQFVAHYEDRGSPFHILILDVEMNGLNGIETARKIRDLNHFDE
jgi:two-component system response regulator LytT